VHCFGEFNVRGGSGLDWGALRAPIAIALGAMGGALCRYYVSLAAATIGSSFPWGTAIVNISGAFLMGLLVALSPRLGLSPDARLLLGTGFLGSYTTFSTYVLEGTTLWQTGQGASALVYCLGSLIGGLVCVGAGLVVGARLAGILNVG